MLEVVYFDDIDNLYNVDIYTTSTPVVCDSYQSVINGIVSVLLRCKYDTLHVACSDIVRGHVKKLKVFHF